MNCLAVDWNVHRPRQRFTVSRFTDSRLALRAIVRTAGMW